MNGQNCQKPVILYLQVDTKAPADVVTQYLCAYSVFGTWILDPYSEVIW